MAVLMCTYCPSDYFADQLESLLAQSHRNFRLWVSDDSPDDSARKALDAYQSGSEGFEFNLIEGPKDGFAANFLTLLCCEDISADYFAFCDQDDVWEQNKLEVAVRTLKEVQPDTPAVYCGRTLLTDESGAETGYSAGRKRKPDFANALVQSLAGGNTMVINQAGRDLVRRAGTPPIVSHDWWVYLLVSGAGGVVLFDPVPTIRYRQHGSNLVGANTSLAANLFRIKMLFHNRFRTWNDVNVRALESAQHLLTPDNRKRFQHFVKARSGNIFSRLYHLRKSGAYRQTVIGNLGLFIATVTGKI
ncbi:glycosyltransferase family 2 protein [Marinobacter segnicrescens]|uniref:glycosyltransferase family 2 protein n=1 Tax=Marinobacter segnicrescens TaxID=430453 RepID=UPI001C42F531|nr:glycosyltransferase family 2 protein [Marinobacter segnicrescens]